MNYDIPFDQFGRQKIVADIINELRSSQKQKYKIVDIGGYKGKTKDLLPYDDVIVTDLYDIEEKDYVRASGLNMPFNDQEFDFSVSFDVLEHVSDSDRPKFIKEALRISKRGVILCVPHATEQNVKAEKILNTYYKKVHGIPHKWLREHIENGLPKMNKFVNDLKSDGYTIVKIYNNDTYLWMLMQGAFFTNEKFREGGEQLTKFNRFINTKLAYTCGDTPLESYRQIVAIMRDHSDGEKIAKQIITLPMSHSQKQDVLKYQQDYYMQLISNMSLELVRVKEESEKARDETVILKKELDLIKNSRAWRLIGKMDNVKRIIKR